MIDDESDYFATETGTWLTNSEKAALQKREEELRSVRHGSRRDRKITFDFAGRRIVETAKSVDMYNVDDEVIQQVHYGSGRTSGDGGAVFTKDDFCNLVNPDIETNPPKVIFATLVVIVKCRVIRRGLTLSYSPFRNQNVPRRSHSLSGIHILL